MGMEEEAEARCSVSTISKDMYVLFEKSLSLSLLDFYHIVAMYYDALRNDEMQVSISFLRVNKFMRNFISYFENQIKSNKFAQSFTYWKEEKNGNE